MISIDTMRQPLIVICFGILISCSGGQDLTGLEARTGASLSEVKQIVDHEGLLIGNIDTVPFRAGTNMLRFDAKNSGAERRRFAIEVRSYPGLWLKPTVTRLKVELSPAESRNVAAEFEFSKVSPYAHLKIRFGDSFEDLGKRVRLAGVFHEQEISRTNEAEINYNFEDYERVSSDHVRLYAVPGTMAAENASNILSVRESAIAEIQAILDVEFDGEVHIALFPTMESKTNVTGHIGAGWAFDNVIVEVYNRDTKLDPYHEPTHVIATSISQAPPSYLEEGLAIYVTERLGGDALKNLGAPGVKTDRAVLNYIDAGRFMPLSELIGHNIGSVYELAPVAYAEAGSLVKYLFEIYGAGKFVELYSISLPLTAENSASENIARLERIYGRPLTTIEKDWLASLP